MKLRSFRYTLRGAWHECPSHRETEQNPDPCPCPWRHRKMKAWLVKRSWVRVKAGRRAGAVRRGGLLCHHSHWAFFHGLQFSWTAAPGIQTSTAEQTGPEIYTWLKTMSHIFSIDYRLGYESEIHVLTYSMWVKIGSTTTIVGLKNTDRKTFTQVCVWSHLEENRT